MHRHAFRVLSAAEFGSLPASGGTYSDAVLSDSPIAYYRLNETSGLTAVNSGTAGWH